MSLADKIEFFVEQYKLQESDKLDATQKFLLDLLFNRVDTYDVWHDKYSKVSFMGEEYKPYGDFFHEFKDSLKKAINKYNPKFKDELTKDGKVEVNTTNKKGDKTGKRSEIKIARWIGQAFPFFSDKLKEKISAELIDKFSPVYANFHMTKDNFEDIVTMEMANRVYFSTTMRWKSLADSCMRYPSFDFNLDNHPYEAYESGDFYLCYLEQDGLLYARTLLHEKSKTYSAVYGVSLPSCKKLEEELHERGYSRVSEDGEEWIGARLRYIENYNDVEETQVFLTPYLDFYDFYAEHDCHYIHLVRERCYSNMVADMFCADGWNEV